MCPQILGIDSYWLMMMLGVVTAILIFRFLTTKGKLPNKAYDYYAFAGVASIAAGLVFAMLFQSFYNFVETGVFVLKGLTFMGGLVGGALTFVTFALSTKNKTIRKCFFPVAEIAVPCILIAHFLGRIGCFLAGCCYGVESEFGFAMHGTVRFPVQLLESLCNFIIAAVIYEVLKKGLLRGRVLYLYLALYAFVRFFDEFLRGDEIRGFILGLSTSQFISIFIEAFALTMLLIPIIKRNLKA
jgi:phosphatidylglycerol:prolipoprotein diacylglycerol transferase